MRICLQESSRATAACELIGCSCGVVAARVVLDSCWEASDSYCDPIPANIVDEKSLEAGGLVRGIAMVEAGFLPAYEAKPLPRRQLHSYL